MGDCVRRSALLALVVLIGVGCEAPSTALVAVELPRGLDFTATELVVFDDAARCDGVDVVGGTEIDRIIMPAGSIASMPLGAGDYIFGAVSFDGDTEIARGCSSAGLESGEIRDLEISMLDVTCFGESAEALALGQIYSGDTVDRADYYRLYLERAFTPAQLAITTELFAGASGMTLNVRTACDQVSTELLSAERPQFPDTLGLSVREPGVYYITVDGVDAPGLYELRVTALIDRETF